MIDACLAGCLWYILRFRFNPCWWSCRSTYLTCSCCEWSENPGASRECHMIQRAQAHATHEYDDDLFTKPVLREPIINPFKQESLPEESTALHGASESCWSRPSRSGQWPDCPTQTKCQRQLLWIDHSVNATHPDNDGTRLVVGSDLEIGTLRDVVVQELEQEVRFLLLETNNATSEALVDIERLLSRYWVCTHHRMLDKPSENSSRAISERNSPQTRLEPSSRARRASATVRPERHPSAPPSAPPTSS